MVSVPLKRTRTAGLANSDSKSRKGGQFTCVLDFLGLKRVFVIKSVGQGKNEEHSKNTAGFD